MIPQRAPGQSFADHQREMAEWLGASVDEMNRCHDPLHHSLCAWLGIPSHAMRIAAGEPVSPAEAGLAEVEEVAALCVQRLMHRAGATVPR